MFQNQRILVVDDSRTLAEVLQTILSPLQKDVLVAGSVGEAITTLEARSDVDLVICDVWLPDGTAFDVLEQLRRGRSEPKPPMVFITARFDTEDRERALAEGALGYLPKPVSLADIRRVWLVGQGGRRLLERAPRRRALTHASVMGGDEDGRLLDLAVLNVSRTGAFLESPGPFPIGTRLRLEFDLAGVAVYATGTVVRVQEPTWLDRGGIGVRFEALEGASRRALEQFLEGAPDEI